MTGSENQLKKLDAIYFNLPKDEFKFLLYICDVVIIMKLPEGWNRLVMKLFCEFLLLDLVFVE